MQTHTGRWWAGDDWLSIWIGASVLAAAAGGLLPALPALTWGGGTGVATRLAASTTGPWLIAGAAAGVLSAVGLTAQGVEWRRFAAGFAVVFGLAWLSLLAAAQRTMTGLGLEFAIVGLLLGLLAGRLLPDRAWLRDAARTEFFIKTGLVVMGATILFDDLVQAGARGMLQAIGVVIVVWYFAFWLARRLRVDDELGVMLASAVSICGVSAAIAACGAIEGDRRKLGYVTSMVLLVSVPMIVVLPWVARAAGLPDAVAGAWMGGTLDTTGSVVAAGALAGEAAMKVATIVKFSQNVLIGVAAVAISSWWAMRRGERREGTGLRIVWDRFPKFVLGFAAASLAFSFLVTPEAVAASKSAIASARSLWFALAFVSIGIETPFNGLARQHEGNPLAAFVVAQAFNVVWTLVLASLIFGGA